MAAEAPQPNKKVLIIDDDTAFAENLGLWLKAHGLESDFATTGEEGLEKARAERPGLIVLDVMMPGIHGLQALRDLRAHTATIDIPVIVFTGVTGNSIEMDAADLNAEFYPKSMDPTILAKKILHKLIPLA